MAPVDFLQLVGHPIRWELLASLATSDRSVRELTDIVDKPQNLVSYHLGQLRTAGLVRSRRSSFDARDSYYAADLASVRDHLAATAGEVHAGLGPNSGVPDRAGATRVLFLCTGNSARSQMAEALVRHRSGGAVAAASAGSHPKPVHPLFERVMRERGIPLELHRSKALDEVIDESFDRVITLCDKVREVCPEFPGRPATAHWSIPDPAGEADPLSAFQAVASELDTRVGFLLTDIDRAASARP